MFLWKWKWGDFTFFLEGQKILSPPLPPLMEALTVNILSMMCAPWNTLDFWEPFTEQEISKINFKGLKFDWTDTSAELPTFQNSK